MFDLTSGATDSTTDTPIPEGMAQQQDATLLATFDSSSSRDVSSLSSAQAKLISILPIPAALLSIFGSLSIIIMVCRTTSRQQQQQQQQQQQRLPPSSRRGSHTTKKKWTPYTRLLMGLSTSDIIMSITLALSSYLLPRESSRWVYAIGSDTTCSLLGAFSQFSYSTSFYNANLCLYFLLTARLRWKNHMIAKYIEPLMHLSSIGFPLLTAGYGLMKGVYHELPLGQGCWVYNYPENCQGLECKDPLIAWIFGGIPTVGSFLIISFTSIIILIFVRKQTWPQRRKDASIRRRQSCNQEGDNTNSPTNITDVSSRTHACDEDDEDCSVSMGSSNSNCRNEVIDGARVRNEEVDNGMLDRIEEGKSQQLTVATRTTTEDNTLSSDANSHHLRKDQLKRLQLLASQAFLYVGAVVLCSVWSGCLRIMEASHNYFDEANLYPLLVLQSIFLPLQGLFNMLVYIRPTYLKCRRHFPNESRLWAYRHVLFGYDDYPKTTMNVRTDKGRGVVMIKAMSPGAGKKHFRIVLPVAGNKGLQSQEGRMPNTARQDGCSITEETKNEEKATVVSDDMANTKPHLANGQRKVTPDMSLVRSLPRHQICRETVSSLSASEGDFDEDTLVNNHSVRKWEAIAESNCMPLHHEMMRRPNHSSLEMISEMTEPSMFEVTSESMLDLSPSSNDGEATVTSISILRKKNIEDCTVRSAPQPSGKRVRFEGLCAFPPERIRRWSASGTPGGFPTAPPLNDEEWLDTTKLAIDEALATIQRLQLKNDAYDGAEFDRMEAVAPPIAKSFDSPIQAPFRRISPPSSECESVDETEAAMPPHLTREESTDSPLKIPTRRITPPNSECEDVQCLQ